MAHARQTRADLSEVCLLYGLVCHHLVKGGIIMKKNLSRMGLPVGFLVLILLLLIPTPPELSTAGHRMLAHPRVLRHHLDDGSCRLSGLSGHHPVALAFLLGTAPNMVKPSKQMLGTSGALKMDLGGFSSTALALVGAALLIAAAVMKTGSTSASRSLCSRRSARRRIMCWRVSSATASS